MLPLAGEALDRENEENPMTLRLKGCPKCHGDVRFDRDQYGWYEQCIQCGFVRDLESMELIWQDCATLAS